MQGLEPFFDKEGLEQVSVASTTGAQPPRRRHRRRSHAFSLGPQVRRPRKAKSGQGRAPTPRSGEPSVCGPGEKRDTAPHEAAAASPVAVVGDDVAPRDAKNFHRLAFFVSYLFLVPFVWLFLLSQLVPFSLSPPFLPLPLSLPSSAIKQLPAERATHAARLRPLLRPALRRPKGRVPWSVSSPAAFSSNFQPPPAHHLLAIEARSSQFSLQRYRGPRPGMANLTGGFASLQCAGAMHVDKGHMQASGLPFLSFRRCAQLDISRLGSMPRFMGARSTCVSQQHVRHRVSAIRASALSSLQDDTTKFFDFVVIGSGVAGLRYALEVSKHGSVAIITKAEPHESNTNYAQGGVSAVLCPSDSVESHMKDTIVAGAYLCDEETVRVVCTEGPERVKELIAMGASFDHGEDGRLHLAREGGHSHNRIVHSADMTGREIERALLQAVDNDDNISLFGHHFAIDLLTCQKNGESYCYGVDSIDIETQKVVRFISKVTLLASGGAGHIYPTTTNPPVATGDGIAMCHRAQAVISNMEFVQFHPTALSDEGLPIKPTTKRENAFLITEAVRGDGGILYNQSMERFMPLYDDRAELAPRDVVARSIDDQLKKRGESYVLLDISHRPRDKVLAHFPNIAAECLRHGLDITRQPIPVVPAAHYMCGGVRAGLQGETNVKGLYVAGEVACTGLHGANRLASNSLLEALVFARRAVQPSIDHMVDAADDADAGADGAPLAARWARPTLPSAAALGGGSALSEIVARTRRTRAELQAVMWEFVGIVRSTARLKRAEWRIGDMEAEWEQFLFRRGWAPTMVGVEACEMRNLFCCAKLVVKSALARRESRGLHFTEDFPYLEESRRKPTVIFPDAVQELTWSSKPLQRQLQCK